MKRRWPTAYKLGVRVAYTYNRKLYIGTITETGIAPDGAKPHVRHQPDWDDAYPISTRDGLKPALLKVIVSAYWLSYRTNSRWVYKIKREAEAMLGENLTSCFNFDWTK